MVKEQKLALRQLQKKIIELIREVDSGEMILSSPLVLVTDDYKYKLEYSKQLKRFLVLVEDEESPVSWTGLDPSK